MITVLPNNVCKEPIELNNAISPDALKRTLVQVAKEENIPVEVADDTFGVNDGALLSGLFSSAAPCIAIYHAKHKRDYHVMVIELKDAYNRHYMYVHFGGKSQNQQNVNMREFKSSGGATGFLSQLFSNSAEAGLREEELYYDVVYQLIGEAVSRAMHMDQTPRQAPRQAPRQEVRHEPQQQTPRDTQPRQTSQPPRQEKPRVPTSASDTATIRCLDVDVGLETMGGVFTKVLERGTCIPARNTIVFSTAADKQTSINIHVLQGTSSIAAENQSLGKFNFSGIKPAPRGVPQIEITFQVDFRGNLDVTAKDLSSGNELTVSVNTTRSVVDAEANADIRGTQAPQEKSKVEQLRELKNLLDEGALTQEEFESLKKSILQQ